jgi:hypothetical protein
MDLKKWLSGLRGKRIEDVDLTAPIPLSIQLEISGAEILNIRPGPDGESIIADELGIDSHDSGEYGKTYRQRYIGGISFDSIRHKTISETSVLECDGRIIGLEVVIEDHTKLQIVNNGDVLLIGLNEELKEAQEIGVEKLKLI